MKKIIITSFIILVTMSLITLVAIPKGEPDLLGRVVEKDGSRLLVISGIPLEEINGNVIEIINSNKYKEAYWITVKGLQSFKNIEVGDQVRVWFSDAVADSYPAQTEAVNIEKIRE